MYNSHQNFLKQAYHCHSCQSLLSINILNMADTLPYADYYPIVEQLICHFHS